MKVLMTTYHSKMEKQPDLSAAHSRRREDATALIETLRAHWVLCVKDLNDITALLDIPGLDVGRVFCFLSTSTDEPIDAADAIERWVNNRLNQLDGYEKLDEEERKALQIETKEDLP